MIQLINLSDKQGVYRYTYDSEVYNITLNKYNSQCVQFIVHVESTNELYTTDYFYISDMDSEIKSLVNRIIERATNEIT